MTRSMFLPTVLAAALACAHPSAQAARSQLETDVLVLGAGAAGLPAALQAAEKGVRVMLLEGRSTLEAGALTADGPLSVDDGSCESSEANAAGDGGVIDSDPARGYPLSSPATVAWLRIWGIEFETIRLSEHDRLEWLVVSRCGEKTHGAAFIGCLKEAASTFGVDIRTSAHAESLVMENGRVTGVHARTASGDELEISAKSVVIAGGDFVRLRREMRAERGLRAENVSDAEGAAPPARALSAAWKAGAANAPLLCIIDAEVENSGVVLKDALFGMAWQPFNLWINDHGKRFVNEAQAFDEDEAGKTVSIQPGGVAWALWDDSTVDHVLKEGVENRVGSIIPKFDRLPALREEIRAAAAAEGPTFVSAHYLTDLAMKMGVSGDALKRTVLAYNRAARSRRDDEFGKPARWVHPLKGPTFYAARLFPFKYEARGGLAINEGFEVLDTRGSPIPGLFAAGVSVGSLGPGNHAVWTTGNALGWSVYSGRMAATEAVRHALEKSR